jgi:hypothetical protein
MRFSHAAVKRRSLKQLGVTNERGSVPPELLHGCGECAICLIRQTAQVDQPHSAQAMPNRKA